MRALAAPLVALAAAYAASPAAADAPPPTQPTLSWPGKADVQPPQLQPAARRGVASRAPAPEAPSRYGPTPSDDSLAYASAPNPVPVSYYVAPPAVRTPTSRPAEAQPLPSSIYAPPSAPRAPALPAASAAPPAAAEPPAQPMQTASATPPPPPPQVPRAGPGEGVRFYSVHREFGIQPDPDPIPPQFFAATPDLSEPAGPLPTRRAIVGGVATGSPIATPAAVNAASEAAADGGSSQ